MGNSFRYIWPPLAVIAVLLAAWQSAVWLWDIPPYKLPGPVAIVREGANVAPRLWTHTLATMQRTLVGLLLGVAAGIALAVFLHLLPAARRALSPMLLLSQNVPVIVLGPLLILWLGFGELPKIVLIMLVCFFPVTVVTLNGLARPDPALANYLAMIGADRWTLFRRLELPGAVPYMFAGLRIGAAYSVTSAIVAEWLGAKNGLGYFITLSANGFQTARVFAAIVVIVALSLLLYGAVAWAERLALRRRGGQGKESGR